jgi:hypothetical protein
MNWLTSTLLADVVTASHRPHHAEQAHAPRGVRRRRNGDTAGRTLPALWLQRPCADSGSAAAPARAIGYCSVQVDSLRKNWRNRCSRRLIFVSPGGAQRERSLTTASQSAAQTEPRSAHVANGPTGIDPIAHLTGRHTLEPLGDFRNVDVEKFGQPPRELGTIDRTASRRTVAWMRYRRNLPQPDIRIRPPKTWRLRSIRLIVVSPASFRNSHP